jgi:16S rRNA (uracil1498-N3)-methyltransferase
MKTFLLDPRHWREPFVLDGPEAHHLGRVLRTAPGETLRGLDGAGRTGLFRVLAVDRRTLTLELLEEHTAPAPRNRTILAVGWVKSARRGWLLEKAVELGAGEIWFWQAAHSQGRVPDQPKDTWTAALAAAAKQCANPRLPGLRTLPSLDALLAAGANAPRRYLLWEDQERPRLLGPAEVTADGGDVLCVLGPEGGLTPREVDALAAAGFAAVSLGPSVLRFETAALAALTLFWWGGAHA